MMPDRELPEDQPLDFKLDSSWQCCRMKVPPEQIAYVSSIFEAYDNHFLVRTEDKVVGIVVVWYAKTNRQTLEEVMLDMRQEFPLAVLSYSDGMEGLDEVYPE